MTPFVTSHWTSRIDITWELIGNTKLQALAHNQTLDFKKLLRQFLYIIKFKMHLS